MFIKEYPELGHMQIIQNTLPVTSAEKKYHYVKVSVSGKNMHLLLTDSEVSRGLHRAQRNADDIMNQVPIKTRITMCVWVGIYASFMTALFMGMVIKYMG